jgi:hypothetical protein
VYETIPKFSKGGNMIRLVDKNVSVETKEMALRMAEQDIKFNRVWYGKRTTMAEIKQIIGSCLTVLERVGVSV